MYRHTLQIALDTHHSKAPNEEEALIAAVKHFLGEWCIDVKIIRLNEELGA